MARIVVTWHDRDGSSTAHEFGSADDAEAWLRSVLREHCPEEELEADGYIPDGIGMLAYYTDEGLDEIGSIELYLDGVGVTPDELSR